MIKKITIITLVLLFTAVSGFATEMTISLKGCHGKYFVAEGNGGNTVNANRSGVGTWEKFTIISQNSNCDTIKDGSSVFIQTGGGYFFSAQSNGALDANRTELLSYETFTLINHSHPNECLQNGDLISLRSCHNKYVVAESNGKANANRSGIGSWERFTVNFYPVAYTNSGSSVNQFKASWYYKALQYQDNIDMYAPLGKAAFITTHNSYNAGVYSQNGSYIDPNQKISLYDQLQIGVRALELDIHYTFSSSGFWPWEWKFTEELKLSHGNGDTGCHPNDRYFTEGLMEIKVWLINNPNEVLILYLEDHMEGQYDRAISEMNGIIGNLVYKPNGCQSLPMNLTKHDVLSAGKQILLIGGNCATSNWSNYVFNGHFSATEDLEDFIQYPICTAGGRNTDYIQSHLVRIYEDSTVLSSLFGDPGPRITAADAANMAECGIGAIGLDQVSPFVSRLKAQIWSWGADEPNDAGGEDYAVQRSDGRFNDVPGNRYYKVACQDPLTDDWQITDNTYTFDQAKCACEDEFPGQGLEFAVPVNGYQNAQLRDVKASENAGNVWINYTDEANEGDWVPGE